MPLHYVPSPLFFEHLVKELGFSQSLVLPDGSSPTPGSKIFGYGFEYEPVRVHPKAIYFHFSLIEAHPTTNEVRCKDLPLGLQF